MSENRLDDLLSRIAEIGEFQIGDQGLELQMPSELNMFLDAVFGRKRLIIIKVNNGKGNIIKELHGYCNEKGLEICNLDGSSLEVNDIRGKTEIVYDEGIPCSSRMKPIYISDSKQMIIVDNLTEKTNIEILRAFMYMGSLGSYYDNIENLPKDKLPYGSVYVFLAEDNFPLKEFASISSYWNDEAAVLNMKDFQTRVKEHLGDYKINKLNVSEEGIFKYQNQEIPYKHILPKEKEKLNIIEKYREDFFNSPYYKDITLHRYFHHLNSSQAMCINFFYPLIKENLLETILNTLGIEGSISYNPDDISFEKESDLETNAERRTNFDFYIRLSNGNKIYFEIKYTENEFGSVRTDDAEHIKKFHDTYMPLIINNPALKEEFKNSDMFLENYQIMRNLSHIDGDSYVVFIYPEGNKAIRNAALSARKDIIKNGWKNHFIPFTWESLIPQLKYNLNSKELLDYYDKEFCFKYLKY